MTRTPSKSKRSRSTAESRAQHAAGEIESARGAHFGRGGAGGGEGSAQRQATSVRQNKPIELYYWPTPNGRKISIMLEECGLPYVIMPVNIARGDQFKPEFLAISPNNRMPAIVDPRRPGRPADLGLRVRRDPAISRPQDRQVLSRRRARRASRSSNGCSGRWAGSARWPGRPPFPQLCAGEAPLCDRPLHQRDATACTACMDRRLADREFLAGEYSIADMACVGGSVATKRQGQDLDEFPAPQALVRDDAWRARRSSGRSRSGSRRPAKVDMQDPKVRAVCSISARAKVEIGAARPEPWRPGVADVDPNGLRRPRGRYRAHADAWSFDS